MRPTTVIHVNNTGDLMPGGSPMPDRLMNSRTGEVLEVVTYGTDWIEVARAPRWAWLRWLRSRLRHLAGRR